MKNTVKQGALALAVLGSAALFAAPAVANSLHDEGDFGGGYRIIGPSGGPERYDYVRHHTFRPYYYGPVDPYGYAPGWNYYYGPGIGLSPGGDPPVQRRSHGWIKQPHNVQLF
jgi:hypothetical protein